jgi:hypothetical protein
MMLCIKHISVAFRDAALSGAPARRERGVVRSGKGVSAHGFLVEIGVVILKIREGMKGQKLMGVYK